LHQTSLAMRQDLERIVELAATEGWTDGTPVSLAGVRTAQATWDAEPLAPLAFLTAVAVDFIVSRPKQLFPVLAERRQPSSGGLYG
jgi:hypothetical protein